MSNPTSSNQRNERVIDNSPHSALTAVVEILNYQDFLDSGKFHLLHSFFNELVNEVYHARWKNYSHSYSAILPEIRIQSGHIYLYSPLYLEKQLPDLSSMVFKLFVESCNMLISVSLSHEIALRGFAGIDEVIKTEVSSGSVLRSEKKDTLMLYDMLKVFSFDEIFPEGVGEVFIPPVVLPVFHSYNFLHANRLLSEIKAIGIYWPDEIRNYPAAEIAIYSDLLTETSLEGKKMFATSWHDWVNKHPDPFSVEELREKIDSLASDSSNEFAHYWKNFNAVSGLDSCKAGL